MNDAPLRRPGDSASETVRRAAIRVAALAQNGLAFSDNPYDLDRFSQLQDVAAELFAVLADRTAEAISLELGRQEGYQTPKVEVRGAIFDDAGRVLMMRETVDGKWSLPGGYADPLDTPSQAVVREILEETGYPAEAVKLVGCWDRDHRGHQPSYPFSMYKLFFLCRVTGTPKPPAELETMEIGWFSLDELPELSTGRVNRWELERLRAHHRDPALATEFD